MMSFIIPLIVLITGASGSGKTTVLQTISKLLSEESVQIFYFDDIGVPSVEEMINQYGSPENWQKAMTEKWIEKLSSINNIKLIFLEGSFNPEFALDACQQYGLKNYKLFCIHADRNIREQRLQNQRLQPELVTDDMQNFAQFLKRKTIELGGTIIENNDASEQVALSVLKNLDVL